MDIDRWYISLQSLALCFLRQSSEVSLPRPVLCRRQQHGTHIAKEKHSACIDCLKHWELNAMANDDGRPELDHPVRGGEEWNKS